MTLVEVLVVVVILGMAAAVGVPMLMQPGSMKIQAASRMIMADIIVAQSESADRVTQRRLHFDVANNKYWLTDGGDVAVGVPWSGGTYQVELSKDSRFSGVKLDAVSFAGNRWVGFDDLGGAVNGGTIDLSAQGFKYQITVRAFTGRVDVARLP